MTLIRTLFLLSFVFMFAGFSKKPVKVQEPETVLPPIVVTPDIPRDRISLYWENTTEPHPERKPWSDLLTSIIRDDLLLYAQAKDIKDICPKYELITEDQRVKAIGEFWVALAYYESGFNPKTNSVDVGTKGDKGSWSVGLYQMSANDNAAKKYGATFESLKDPLVNIKVATEQMRRQIKNCGEIILPNSSKCRYWAIILTNNRYNKINEVKSRVLKNSPFCK